MGLQSVIVNLKKNSIVLSINTQQKIIFIIAKENEKIICIKILCPPKHCRQTDAQFSFRVDDNLLAEAPTKNSYIIKMTFIALQADQRTQ